MRLLAKLTATVLGCLILGFGVVAQAQVLGSDVEAVLREKGVSAEDLQKSIDLKMDDTPQTKKINNTESLTQDVQLPSRLEMVYNPLLKKYGLTETLKQLGYELFDSAQVATNRQATIPAPDSYTLGPGDELEIFIWGKVQQRFTLSIDQSGRIFLPKYGPLQVLGQSVRAAQINVRNSLNTVFANVDISVGLSKYRSVKVYVMGEVNVPGAYVLPAGSNAFAALLGGGGIKKSGTLRGIQLLRYGRVLRNIDLYTMIQSGRGFVGDELVEGDVIYVPTLGDTVAVVGAVKKPGIYEVLDKSKVSSALAFAGGALPLANPGNVLLERTDAGQERVAMDLAFDRFDQIEKSAQDLKLQNGDLLVFRQSPDGLHKSVSVEGHILRPGIYEWREGMTVADLLKKAGGALPGTYMARADLSRTDVLPVRKRYMAGRPLPEDLGPQSSNEDFKMSRSEILAVDLKQGSATKLVQSDRLIVYAEEEVVPTQSVRVSGAVARPGEYVLRKGMKVSDLVFAAGGLLPEADRGKAKLSRFENYQTLVSELSFMSNTGDFNKTLQDRDQLFIATDQRYFKSGTVTLKGEVRFPGVYPIAGDTRLVDILEQAGGFTDEAFPFGTVFIRPTVIVEQQLVGQKIQGLEYRDLLQLNLLSTTATGTKLSDQKSLLQNLYNETPEGRLVIDMADSIKEQRERNYRIYLQDKDEITVPKKSYLVQVIGAVFQPGPFFFKQGSHVQDYMEQAGGPNRFADTDSLYIIRANGRVSRDRSAELGMGDVIVVPSKIEKPFDLFGVVSSVATLIYNVAASISILRNL